MLNMLIIGPVGNAREIYDRLADTPRKTRRRHVAHWQYPWTWIFAILLIGNIHGHGFSLYREPTRMSNGFFTEIASPPSCTNH